jgi:hypothetical protein
MRLRLSQTERPQGPPHERSARLPRWLHYLATPRARRLASRSTLSRWLARCTGGLNDRRGILGGYAPRRSSPHWGLRRTLFSIQRRALPRRFQAAFRLALRIKQAGPVSQLRACFSLSRAGGSERTSPAFRRRGFSRGFLVSSRSVWLSNRVT